jgi:DNA-binding NtrC family response regulator
MEGLSGIEVLKEIREQRPETKVIMLTAHADLESAIEALRLGAFDYLRKEPQAMKEITLRVSKAFETLNLNRQNIQLRRDLERVRGFAGMVGTSPSMKNLYQIIEQVSITDATVLIRGETGTGKELVARAIHQQSHRKDKPFLVVDCNIPETLAECELFGVTKNYPGFHRKEALTGQFELADGGTLFLDEIGDLAFSVQSKLLRAIQEKEIRPLGSEHIIQVDVRVIAATNRNLEQAMKDGHFRTDLFHRLNVMTIETPALRQRKEDIPQLVDYFIEKSCEKLKRLKAKIAEGAINLLLDYSYPGNVRELENIIERAVILSLEDEISSDVILINLKKNSPDESAESAELEEILKRWANLKFSEARDTFEKTYLELLLQQTKGNISQSAKKAGIDRKNFKQKLRKHNIVVESFVNQ